MRAFTLVLALMLFAVQLGPGGAGVTAVTAAGSTNTILQIQPPTTHPYETVQLTATTTPAPSDGRVEFRVTSPTSFVAADVPVGAGGITTAEVKFGALHTFKVVAKFYGSATFGVSQSDPVSVSVTRIPTTIEVELSAETITAADSITARATLSPVPDNRPFEEAPVGFVFTSSSGHEHWTWAMPNAVTGVAEVSVPAADLVPELWTVRARYGPTLRYGYSEDEASFRFEPLPPTVTLEANPSEAYAGDPVTLTVTVEPVPDGGTIELRHGDSANRIDKSLGTKPIGGAHGGNATFTTSFAPGEGLALRAFYSGTASTPASRSSILARKELRPPSTFLTFKPNPWSASAVNQFAFTGSASVPGPVTFECNIDGGSWQPCSSPRQVGPLADGPHVFGVRATDANGRAQEHPEYWEWRIDTSPPTLSVVLNNSAPYVNSNKVRVKLNAVDQWYVSRTMVYGLSVLDKHGVLANPQGDDQFQAEFDYDHTRPAYGGSTVNGPRTIYFQVADAFGHWSEVVSASFIYDSVPPSVSAPTTVLVPGKTSGSGIPVGVSWPAASDSLSGVSAYELQRSTNGGPWATVSLSSNLARNYTQNLAKGNTYAFRVRARDGAGNWSPWVAGSTVRAQLRQEKHASIKYVGAWPRKALSGAWGGYVKRAKAAGVNASITFTGSSIGWVSALGPKRGQARIYVDGQLEATVDLYAASKSPRRLVWQKSWTSPGKHTIQIRVVGTANRPAVDLDAFVLLGAP